MITEFICGSGVQGMVTHYCTLWLSDIHFGTPGCKAEYLLDFLRYNEADTIYLVGDILDGFLTTNTFVTGTILDCDGGWKLKNA